MSTKELDLKEIGSMIFGGLKLAGKVAKKIYMKKVVPKIAETVEELKKFAKEDAEGASVENQEAKPFYQVAKERKQKYDELIALGFTHEQAISKIAKGEKE